MLSFFSPSSLTSKAGFGGGLGGLGIVASPPLLPSSFSESLLADFDSLSLVPEAFSLSLPFSFEPSLFVELVFLDALSSAGPDSLPAFLPSAA